MPDAIVGYGANLGAREARLWLAIHTLAHRKLLRCVAISELYESEAVGPQQPDYLNAAFRVSTGLSPRDLLIELLAVEQLLGRDRRNQQHWGPRRIDLDLLWYDGVEIDEEDLCVPHAELSNRHFALNPMLDVFREGHVEKEYYQSITCDLAYSSKHHMSKRVERLRQMTEVTAKSPQDALTLALHYAQNIQSVRSAVVQECDESLQLKDGEICIVDSVPDGDALSFTTKSGLDIELRKQTPGRMFIASVTQGQRSSEKEGKPQIY